MHIITQGILIVCLIVIASSICNIGKEMSLTNDTMMDIKYTLKRIDVAQDAIDHELVTIGMEVGNIGSNIRR